MKKILQCFLFLTTIFWVHNLWGQSFPVQATVQLTPPYSLYLADYAAPGSNRIGMNVLLRDLARPELQTRLRLTIEGTGVLITTHPEYRPQPIFLQGGVPLILTADDLDPYFNPDNLVFQGVSKQQIQKGGALPEGLYRICFEVLEYNLGAEVSNRACGAAWLVLNDPPIINVPDQGEKLRAQEPQNVLFQWTPRHTGSPNAAFSTEYDFQLVELWPDNRNPNSAIQTLQPIYETTTFSTTLVYGPAETPLVPGRKYAFRVRAKAMTGVDQLDLFKNHGYSEVFTFTYGDACTPPTDIEAVGISSNRVNVSWTGLPQHTEFIVRYKKERENRTWKEQRTFLTELVIDGLQPQTAYEFEVKPLCSTLNGETTETVKATTKEQPATDFACGAEPGEFNLDSQAPLPELKWGDYIKAADFDVMVMDVRGSNGTFSGRGLAEMPWLKQIKVRVAFNNIFVNADYQLIRGGIKTIFNPDSKMMVDLDKLKDEDIDEESDQGDNDEENEFDEEDVTIDSEVDSVTIDESTGDIIVVLEGGGTKVIKTKKDEDSGETRDTRITDASGDTWVVDNEGKVS